MSNDIRDILSRLTALEGKITPVGVKHGLNKQQDSVPQLPALFKPRHISVLGAKKDPKHPMSGYAVGADESAEPKATALAEAMAEIEEDMLSKVKRDLTTYLDRLEQKVKADPELLDKAVDDVEDKNPAKAGKQSSHDSKDDIDENDYELTDPSTVHDVEDKIDVAAAQPQAPIKTMECGTGIMFEIHGDESNGFEVRHQGRSIPSRFRSMDDAEMACNLFKAHRANKTGDADYVDER
jgi:hypothetical protein